MNCNSIESSGWGQHPKWIKCKRSQTMEHFDSGCPVRQRWNSERWDSQSLTDLNSIFNCKNVITWPSWIVRFNLNKRLTKMLIHEVTSQLSLSSSWCPAKRKSGPVLNGRSWWRRILISSFLPHIERSDEWICRYSLTEIQCQLTFLSLHFEFLWEFQDQVR